MNIKKLINLYKKEMKLAFDSISIQKIVEFVELIFEVYENEGTIFACGNGGNTASIQNLVVDFNLHPFVNDNKGVQNIPRNNFKCVSLCSDQATLTGITNDLGFMFVFSEQLKYQGKEGDLLIGTSGSGNSKNVLEAFKIAKQKKMKNILITRNKENNCNTFADLIISLDIVSQFPGQTGNNNANFFYEDLLSSLTHIAVGLLKEKVQNANQPK
jgi:D-sedoheptulose 7-phosphate isomerase